MSIFDFLGETQEQALPEGGAAFANSGFVGLLMAEKWHKFWSGEDVVLYELGVGSPEDYVRYGKDGSWQYYFRDGDKAKEIAKALDAFAPSRAWMFAMQKSTIKNVQNEEALSKGGSAFTVDCMVTTLGATRNRHQYHMVTMPSVVNAFAVAAGMVPAGTWHLNEIVDGIADEAFTKAFSDRMVGDMDATEDDAEKIGRILEAVGDDLPMAHKVALGDKDTVAPDAVADLYGKVKIHYTYSILWKRREALWAALGESNPATYIPAGMAQTEAGKEYETSAPNLVKCLGVTVSKWTKPVWARFHYIKDLHCKAITKAGKRLYLPLVTEVFTSEADADAAAKSDLAGRETNTPSAPQTAPPVSSPVPSTQQYPPYPSMWAGHEEVWRKTIADEKQNVSGKLPPLPLLTDMAARISATPDDIHAWWDAV